MDRSMTELRSVTCHMGSHSVTCYPTQVSAPRLNPSHAGRYSIYLPRRNGRLSWPCYSETQPPGVELATSRSRIQRPNHWATKRHTVRRYGVTQSELLSGRRINEFICTGHSTEEITAEQERSDDFYTSAFCCETMFSHYRLFTQKQTLN